MQNNIMAVGSRDRPPMYTTGRYAQWQSRFLRYIDTRPNGDALRKCILEGPYAPSTVINPAVPSTDDSPEVPERTAVETILNTSPENKEPHDMWIAIERLQQGESLNIQDVKTNLYWEFGKFSSYDGESMESYYSKWSRLVTIIKQNHDLDTVSYHKLFDVLKQYQKKVNEIRVERITKNTNPLALVTAAQQYPNPYYQAPKSHKSYATPSKQSSSTRSNASTKYKGKEIAKPITPPSESTSE
ncbi:hypothetical protein Tco_0320165 [Tanacetum coccineum]